MSHCARCRFASRMIRVRFGMRRRSRRRWTRSPGTSLSTRGLGSAAATLTRNLLRLEDVGRNYDSWSCSIVLHPMHGAFILVKGSSSTILFCLAPAMVDDGSLHDVVGCRSVLVVVNPQYAAGFDGANAHPTLASGQ